MSVARAVESVRRTPELAQRDFRTLIDVLARPGVVGQLEVRPPAPAATIPVAGLADLEVSLAVLSSDTEWRRVVELVTAARPAALEQARMVLALRPITPDEIALLSKGDPLAPELGARLVQAVDALGEAGEVSLSLRGPGVPGTRRLAVRGLPVPVFDALSEANQAFPAGIDTFLVAADGKVAGLPRSVRIDTEVLT